MYYIIPNLLKQISKFSIIPKYILLNGLNESKLNITLLCENTNAFNVINKLYKSNETIKSSSSLSNNINMIKILKKREITSGQLHALIKNKNAYKLIKCSMLNKSAIRYACGIKHENIKYLMKKIIKDPKLFIYVNLFEFCRNPMLIKLTKKLLLTDSNYIDWYGLCENPKAINIIKREFALNRFKNIKWENLVENINAFDIVSYILQNYPVELKTDPENINKLKLLKNLHDPNINWHYLSQQEYAIDILEEIYKTNPAYIDWINFSANPKKTNLFRLELINSKREKRQCLIYDNIIHQNECLFNLINLDKKLSKYDLMNLCQNSKAINFIINRMELSKINNTNPEMNYYNYLSNKYYIFKKDKLLYYRNIKKFVEII